MERLLDLMERKGYFKKQQQDILLLFEHINADQKERTIRIFMDFIESSERYFDALTLCTKYVYELYGGTKARTEILAIFHERDYDVLEAGKVLNLFGDIPFEEKENLAKRILPMVIEIKELNLILKNAKQIVSDFKKEKNIIKTRN